VQTTEGDGPKVIEVRVQGGHEQRILVAEAQSSTIAFSPNPESPTSDERRVEKTTRDAHFWGSTLLRVGEAAGGLGEREGGFGDGQVSNRRRVQAGLLHATPELAGGASAPREDLQDGGVAGCCVGGVKEWGLRGSGKVAQAASKSGYVVMVAAAENWLHVFRLGYYAFWFLVVQTFWLCLVQYYC